MEKKGKKNAGRRSNSEVRGGGGSWTVERGLGNKKTEKKKKFNVPRKLSEIGKGGKSEQMLEEINNQ